jgi:hypothetical protein
VAGVLFATGLSLLAFLILDAGAGAVLDAMWTAGALMPLIVLFDAGWFVAEVAAHRTLLGPDAKRIPNAVYVRASLEAYAFVVLAPLGRLGAEAIRGVAFARFIGAPRAVAAGGNVQIASLCGNMFGSLPCAAAVFWLVGTEAALGWLVLGNAVLTGALGVGSMLLVRRGKLGARLAARWVGLVHRGAELDEALRVPRATMARAIAIAFLGRLSQAAQYGVILFALVSSFSVAATFALQGIHLVGAAVGDAVPGQLGVVEGSYRLFADVIGLGDRPAYAVSVGLLARASQILLAAATLVGLALLPRRREVAEPVR